MLTLLIIVLVLGLVVYLIQTLPISSPFKEIALVIVVLIAVIYLLGIIGVGPGFVRLP